MGCIVSLLAVATLIATYDTVFFPFAVATAVVLFWANGVIANFRHNPLEAPNWAAIASMVATIAALVLLIAGVVARTTSGGSLSWNDASDHVGETKRVCGPLRGMAEDGGDTFLNIGKAYPEPGRFTIVVWNTTGQAEPSSGAEVCIKGEISTYQGVAQIETQDWNDLSVGQ